MFAISSCQIRTYLVPTKAAGGCIADDFCEDGDDAEEEERFVEEHHRHFDAFMEQEPPGKRYPARMRGAFSAKRREHSKLAVSRYANPEPIGQMRIFSK